jgi:hydroxymethylpyrimidine/phosphomethylpyrimidine kinase
MGVFGTTAITCVTAQSTKEVRSVFSLPGAMVREQVETVLDDIAVSGAKTGVLPNEEIVQEVVALVPRLPPLVVDPVLVASTGRNLTDAATIRACLHQLFPLAGVVTPNLMEAGVLLGEDLATVEDARRAARRLGEWAPVVVVKGGHLADPTVSVDVVWDGESCWEISRPRVHTLNVHGTGCTFSAAIAAGMALGCSVREAIEGANAFVYAAIQGSAQWHLGAGAGPLDHFGWEKKQNDGDEGVK